MGRFILFILAYFFVCIAFFWIIQKTLFCFYNRKSNSEKMHFSDLKQIYSHGLVTDAIVASYLTAIPLLLTWAYAHLPYFKLCWWLMFYNILVSIAISLITVADIALYKFWQFKIDSSIFTYLKSIKGTFASVSILYVVSALLAVSAISGILFGGVQFIINMYCPSHTFVASEWVGHLLVLAVTFVFVLCLFIIIRGMKIRPNNPSIAYYSKNPFYNHTALNPLYNLIYSLSVKDDFANQFHYFKENYRAKVFKPLFPVKGTPTVKLLNTTRPNIVLIIWESLCARYVNSLGGIAGVTVNFDRLANEGVLFTRCDAGSFRTDRGLVCLLSGYLGQPTTSVIKYTRKLPHLPAFPRILKHIGYSTMALHGGDLAIMHKSDYYLASGHDKLVSQKDFPFSAPACKWGIQDGYTFSWLFDDIQKKTQQGIQWYTTYQTLSSHEPFDVPYNRLKNDKTANSFAYVDECFGLFIDKLKASHAWDNLLVICTGDHGFNLDQPLSRNEYPHIPILLLGGAVKQAMKIDTIISQTDLAATLLGQLDLPHEEFIFSRDVLADTYIYPFSFHTYNNGFLFRDATGYTNYDNVADLAIEGPDSHREELGKAILQTLYDDLSRR